MTEELPDCSLREIRDRKQDSQRSHQLERALPPLDEEQQAGAGKRRSK